jgi:hypothetical protein
MSDNRIYYSREAEVRAHRQRIAAVFVFMALGLGIGAVLAFIFSPQARKVREKVSSAVEEGLDTGREKVSDVLSDLEDEYPGVLRKFETILSGLH